MPFEYQMNRKRETIDNKNKRKLPMELLLKDKNQLGEDIDIIYMLSSFRNVIYNAMEETGLGASHISIIFWGYPYTFFSREGMVQSLRIGRVHSNRYLRELEEEGWLDQYSIAFWIEQEKDKYSDVMDYTYGVTEDKYVGPRYRLSRKANMLINRIVKEVRGNLVKAWPWETRDSEIDRIAYLKKPADPNGNYNYPPNWK